MGLSPRSEPALNPERDHGFVRPGAYARKQIYCPSRIVAWSHGSRFQLGRALVQSGRGGRLLDYGCGDGTFIAMVHAEFAETAGADVEPRQIADCAERLGHLRGVTFGLTRDLEMLPRWDVVTCMEVLEHCLDAERRRVIGQLARLVAPGGRLVVSVPIEVGPAVVAKQSMRAIAGLRRLGDYRHRERYSPVELLRSAAGLTIPRVVLQGEGVDGPYAYFGHKGFDYRIVQAELAAHVRIDRRVFTPIGWLGPVLNSQVWFVCSSRA